MALLHRFIDRAAAGVALARELKRKALHPPWIVLGLARGGVAVAVEVAARLGAPLDVMLVRKIGMPGQAEFAIGAIAWGGITVRDPHIVRDGEDLGAAFDALVVRERRELERRERVFRAGLAPLTLTDKTVILVDDGIATGWTMLAAVRAAHKAGAAHIIAAAPVASHAALGPIRAEADDVVIVHVPPQLMAIGEWYEHFEQLEDTEVSRLLAKGRTEPAMAE